MFLLINNLIIAQIPTSVTRNIHTNKIFLEKKNQSCVKIMGNNEDIGKVEPSQHMFSTAAFLACQKSGDWSLLVLYDF